MDLTHHQIFLQRHGFLRWVLRECVRANPLYVISAAMVGYGLLSLNGELDPRVGQIFPIVLTLALLHVYEIAVLIAATIVLKKRRSEGGVDLHGLGFVAMIFLGGSFLALDELVTLFPGLRFVLVPAALLLAWMKLTWYARLPGINLPLAQRHVALGILAAHSVSVMIGQPDPEHGPVSATIQRLAWLPGWLSLVPLIWLIHRERAAIARAEIHNDEPEPDVLQTPWCGVFMLMIVTLTGVMHLFSAGWVFDWPADNTLLLPSLCVLLCAGLVRRWHQGRKIGVRTIFAYAAPALLAQRIWSNSSGWRNESGWALLLSPAMQFSLAGMVFYLALTICTQQRSFLLGLIGPLAAPLWARFWPSRGGMPHFKALLSVAIGFILLIGGMIMSVYRERILRRLDPVESEEIPAE